MTKDVFDYIKKSFKTEPEYLWISNPDTAVFRNSSNKKWFAVYMGKLPKSKFGVESEEFVDVLNLKVDPLMSYSIVDKKRIFPGYHMNKEHWISVVLDGSVPTEELQFLIGESYNIIESKKQRKKEKRG